VTISERLREVREQGGLSLRDVEKRTGLLPGYVSRVENGHSEPRINTLIRFAEGYDMTLAELVTGVTSNGLHVVE
jgi:transcriptional regulator with XRE-family HTH domain